MTLRNHPFAVEAWFEWSLALVFAWPAPLLAPLLGRGLELDTYEGHGFVAVAVVQTKSMRPAGLPAWLGRNFLLTGYRVFARYRTAAGRSLRGLRILRSDTNRRTMVWAGNLFTHYNYHHAHVRIDEAEGSRWIDVRPSDGAADLRLRQELGPCETLPADSLFPDWHTARLWAGPMPFTFDAMPEGVLRVEGVRRAWKPRPVAVEIERLGFFDQPLFRSAGPPRLANAFLVEGVPYRWEKGIFEPHPTLEEPA